MDFFMISSIFMSWLEIFLMGVSVSYTQGTLVYSSVDFFVCITRTVLCLVILIVHKYSMNSI